MSSNIKIEIKLEIPDYYDERKCRVCLLEGTLYIFSEAYDLLEPIKLFGGIDLSRDDPFPKYLCHSCYSLLQNAILFRYKAQETNSQLLKGINQNLEASMIEKGSIKSESTNVLRNYVINTPEEYEDSIKSEGQNICIDNFKDESEKAECSIKGESPNESNICVKNTQKAKKVSIKRERLNKSRNVSNSNNGKVYQCDSCEIEFSKAKDYFSHRKSKHSHIQCPVCLKLLKNRFYKKHLECHQTDAHVVCEICGKLTLKGTMTRHLQLHNNNLPFPCKLCPYRGRYAESLKLHMSTHTGHKPYSCNVCQLRFLTKSNLSRHSVTHSKLKPHKCAECDKAFSFRRDMLLHVKIEHNGIKDFECEICGNKYGAKRVLRKHELRVHKRDKMASGRKPLYLQPEFKTTVKN